MPMANPAHVGCPVTHGASAAKIAFGVIGVAAGGVLAVFLLPEEAAGSVVLGAIAVGGGVADGQFVGNLIGSAIDSFTGPQVSGHITTGLDTVLLGPAIKPAAWAEPSSTAADCAGGGHGFEGSQTVLLGPTMKPMSRKGDRLKCQGVIADGLHSVAVGGPPSQHGKDLEEAQPLALEVLDWGTFIAGFPALVTSIPRLIKTVPELVKNLPEVIKAGDKLPWGDIFDVVDNAHAAGDAAQRGADVASGSKKD